MDAVEFGGITPIVRVKDLDASLRYYIDVLGFGLHWRELAMASVGRGKTSIMLTEFEQGHIGSWVFIGVSDADALHEELRAKGALIRLPPGNYPWGARELHVNDPDGNVLRLASDAVPGQPIGDWIDGDGQRWTYQADGSWREVE